MAKKTLTFLFISVFLLPMQLIGQTVESLPFSESFENGLGAWTVIDNNGDESTWEIDSAVNEYHAAHEGTFYASSASWVWPNGGITPDDYLVSPPIALTGNAELRWWDRTPEVGDRSNEHYSVYISTTGNTMADFAPLTPVFSHTLGWGCYMWTQRTVSLAAYAGDTVWIASRHHNCTDQKNLLIDDISVFRTVDDSVGIYGGSDVMPMVTVYPNPTHGEVTVCTGEPALITVVDIKGRMVIAPTTLHTTLVIPRSVLTTGLYFVRASITTGTIVKTLVVE